MGLTRHGLMRAPMRSKKIPLVDTVAGLRWGAVLGLYHAAGDADDVIRDLQEVPGDVGGKFGIHRNSIDPMFP